MKISLLVLLVVAMSACTSVSVKPLGSDPAGVPFYLTKPMLKRTTTTYEFFQADKLTAGAFHTASTEEVEIVNVIDRSAGYTVNHRRPFAGESKFSVEIENGVELAKVSTEDEEGVTEFLKGLVEGAKTLTEVAEKVKAGAGAPAGISDAESQYFQSLAGSGIVVTKRVAVTLTDLP